MNTKQHHALMPCPVCGNTIERKTRESWPTYYKKTACSTRCSALHRESKIRNADSAVKALERVIWNWKIAA